MNVQNYHLPFAYVLFGGGARYNFHGSESKVKLAKKDL